MPTVRRAFAIAAALLLLCGCPNPNTYGGPRTVPKGEQLHTVAVEAYYGQGTYDGTLTQPDGTVIVGRQDVTRATPHVPTYVLRHGLAQKVDAGFRLVNLSSPAFDLKWNFLRGDIDLAIDPGIHWAPINTKLHVFHLHAPLLVGFNVSDYVTLVLAPGAAVTFSAGDPPDEARQQLQTASGIAARLGAGVNLRLGEQLAIHPEVTVLRRFDDSAFTWLTFGVGFSFGTLPRYRANPALQETPESVR
jgi:hypothetical protein